MNIDPQLRIRLPMDTSFDSSLLKLHGLGEHEIAALADQYTKVTGLQERWEIAHLRVLGLDDEKIAALEAENRRKANKTDANWSTGRVGFEFCPQIEPSRMLAGYVLFDIYPGRDGVDGASFLKQTEFTQEGEIGLLTRGMTAIDGQPVTLLTNVLDERGKPVKDDHGKQALTNLEPLFAVVGWKVEGVHKWPSQPRRDGPMVRLTVNASEVTHAIRALPAGLARFHRAFSMDDRRTHTVRLLGQAHKVTRKKASRGGLQSELGGLVAHRLVVAREPFMIRNVERRNGKTFVHTPISRYGLEVKNEGKGPFIVVPPSARAIIVLLEEDFVHNVEIAFSLLAERARKFFEAGYGELPRREIRPRKERPNYRDAQPLVIGDSEEEPDEEPSPDEDQDESVEPSAEESSGDGSDDEVASTMDAATA